MHLLPITYHAFPVSCVHQRVVELIYNIMGDNTKMHFIQICTLKCKNCVAFNWVNLNTSNTTTTTKSELGPIYRRYPSPYIPVPHQGSQFLF